jgi:hypothetical protein
VLARLYDRPAQVANASDAVQTPTAETDLALRRQIGEASTNPWLAGPPTIILDPTPRPAASILSEVWGRTLGVPLWYARPFLELFSARSSWKAFSFALLCSLWLVAVWAFCGGLITRLSALRLSQDRRTSLWFAAGQTFRRWRAYFFAPIFPLAGVFLLLLLPGIVSGWLARFDFMYGAAGIFWFIGLAAGLLAAVFLVALYLGWPLMWATISTESTDAFDAFSRSFSYVTQRPFHFVFYLVLAAVLGAFGWLVVTFFAELGVYLSIWAFSWGKLPGRAAELLAATTGGGDSLPIGARAIAWWRQALLMVVIAYGHSFLWTAASGIYLLLRRDTDATPLDDIHLDEAEDPYGLPPIKRDAAGVPVLDREADQPAGVTA